MYKPSKGKSTQIRGRQPLYVLKRAPNVSCLISIIISQIVSLYLKQYLCTQTISLYFKHYLYIPNCIFLSQIISLCPNYTFSETIPLYPKLCSLYLKLYLCISKCNLCIWKGIVLSNGFYNKLLYAYTYQFNHTLDLLFFTLTYFKFTFLFFKILLCFYLKQIRKTNKRTLFNKYFNTQLKPIFSKSLNQSIRLLFSKCALLNLK